VLWRPEPPKYSDGLLESGEPGAEPTDELSADVTGEEVSGGRLSKSSSLDCDELLLG
jgi:hypothetical protein